MIPLVGISEGECRQEGRISIRACRVRRNRVRALREGLENMFPLLWKLFSIYKGGDFYREPRIEGSWDVIGSNCYVKTDWPSNFRQFGY